MRRQPKYSQIAGSKDFFTYLVELHSDDLVRIDPVKARERLGDAEFEDFKLLVRAAAESFAPVPDESILKAGEARRQFHRETNDVLQRSGLGTSYRAQFMEAYDLELSTGERDSQNEDKKLRQKQLNDVAVKLLVEKMRSDSPGVFSADRIEQHSGSAKDPRQSEEKWSEE